ncbi:hypothetical protein IQ243_02605 [Nostocales cyanobacterium LEGE 11386]|nr:hypothetical protein [Nostocales cyanobacterium LEGE 11386]
MSIPHNRESENTDIHGNTRTNLTRNTETLHSSDSYGQGYVQGRNIERHYQQANLAERDNNNASRGLLLGIIFTSLVAVIVGFIWYFNQRNNTPAESVVPVLVPTPDNTSPSPQPQTTIIERTREVPVEVPIPVPVSPPSLPESNSPATQTPIPTNPTPNIPNSETGNDSSPNIGEPAQTTPPQGVDESNGTSNSGASDPGENSTDAGSAQ